MNDPAPQAPALLWTVRETGRALRLSERTVFRFIKSGEIPAVRLGRALRIDPRDLADLIERLKTSPVGAVEGRP